MNGISASPTELLKRRKVTVTAPIGRPKGRVFELMLDDQPCPSVIVANDLNSSAVSKRSVEFDPVSWPSSTVILWF